MTDTNYTFDYSMLAPGSASFIANEPAAASAPAAAPAAASSAGGAPAGADASGLLSASPFAPLLSLPGINADTLLASLSEGNGFGTLAALGTDAGNPLAGLTGSGNPFPAGSANAFENYVGANNPFASSSNPFSGINPTGA